MNAASIEQRIGTPSDAGPVRNLAAAGAPVGNSMILPAQFLLLFIVLFPLLMQIYISLTYWGPTDGVRAGSTLIARSNLFDNYVDFFTDGELWAAMLRTLVHHGAWRCRWSFCSVLDWRRCSSTASRGGASSTRFC